MTSRRARIENLNLKAQINPDLDGVHFRSEVQILLHGDTQIL